MGFIPILLTLTSFILLFGMVVNHSIAQKKEQYKAAVSNLRQQLAACSKTEVNLDNIQAAIESQFESGHPERKKIKTQLGQAKLLKHQYNELIKTTPYSIVAKITGQGRI
ncbi:hypothetical protein DN752_17240 [Echinicola strongylocentroti]|uniref:Uncharacterized protein n=1 Tax=Echinicola strongylocentroti TaxID=1795355 RepID=A0A2Z4ILH5_9BACT|nr:hypothetical protein [Echinicola strongylocentroti]AWW31734.1 hypothetical protein DN752_17240 [Echinicola strongylocentroti]